MNLTEGYTAMLLMVGPPPWLGWEHSSAYDSCGRPPVWIERTPEERATCETWIKETSTALRALIIECPDITRRGFIQWCRREKYGARHVI